jgi:hypothetical protein
MITATKHASNCKMAFGRKDKNCPRCQELLSGLPAREGWQTAHFAAKTHREQVSRDSLRTHNCKSAGCHPMCCTFGDW